MKINKRGSILIWSIFLMVFISSSFIYVSIGIKKHIENNKHFETKVQKLLLENKKSISKNTDLGSNENLEIFYFNTFSGALKIDEKMDFSFLELNTGDINILSGGPIFYETFSGSEIYSSGMIFNNENISLSGSLSLKNLGGFTNFSIDFSTGGIILPYNYYKITKNIGLTKVLKSFGEY